MGISHVSGLAVGQLADGFTKGTGLTYIERGTVAIDPASLAAGAEAETTVTLANLKLGDSVMLNQPAAGLTAGIELVGARVSADTSLIVRLRNNTGGAIDEPSGVWTYLIIR